MNSNKHFCLKLPGVKYDYLAPDGSEISVLQSIPAGGLSHCKLSFGKISTAVYHKTVSEIWYVLSGVGEMWQAKDQDQSVFDLQPGLSLTIPVGNRFQFRNSGSEDLCILIVTVPDWPGASEAVAVPGHWDTYNDADPAT